MEYGNVEYWYCEYCNTVALDSALRTQTNMMSIRVAGACVSDSAYACQDGLCINCGLPCAAEATHEYTYACDAHCAVCGELTNESATHSIIAVDAVAPTCYENGNIAYWYCEICGIAWADEALTQQTNLLSVILPMAHAEATHVVAKAPTCYEDGNIEYWYCEACGQAWLDEACTLNTNLMAVVLPMAHAELTHVEAVAPTCFENGNIEYWYCEACGYAWLDAEGTLSTNLMAVVLPMAHGELTHVAAKDATCTENGNIEYWYCEACGYAWLDAEGTLSTNLLSVVLPMADHTYDNEYDADCNVCGAIREVELAIITIGGTSRSESVNGLAFKFNANVPGLTVKTGTYFADYDNCDFTFEHEGVEYTLESMGAVVSNLDDDVTYKLDAVDGNRILDIPAEKLYKVTAEYVSYVIRIINIPSAYADVHITAHPYVIGKDIDGNEVALYFEAQTDSYNGI